MGTGRRSKAYFPAQGFALTVYKSGQSYPDIFKAGLPLTMKMDSPLVSVPPLCSLFFPPRAGAEQSLAALLSREAGANTLVSQPGHQSPSIRRQREGEFVGMGSRCLAETRQVLGLSMAESTYTKPRVRSCSVWQRGLYPF